MRSTYKDDEELPGPDWMPLTRLTHGFQKVAIQSQSCGQMGKSKKLLQEKETLVKAANLSEGCETEGQKTNVR